MRCGQISISYRRDDAAGYARAPFDQLVQHFSSLMGSMLDVKPVVGLKNGKLSPRSKHRGTASALASMAVLVHEDYRLFHGDCDIWIAHANAADKAQTLTALLEERIPAARGRIQLAEVGPTITAHAGPGCICVSVVPI